MRSHVIPAGEATRDQMDLETLEEWKGWLSENHLTSNEIWLIMRKGKRSGSGLTMRDAIDEAICFGWIDSRTKRLDQNRYMIRFTPRKNETNWSARNLERARQLFDQGRMTEAGISKLPPDFRTLVSLENKIEDRDIGPPPDLEAALRSDPELWGAYSELAQGKRKEFDRWVLNAKRHETRQKRIERTIELIRTDRSLSQDMMGRWSKK
jgi:uncharacterized protein YdeI (YjbR/CyaY-like superfamily)